MSSMLKLKTVCHLSFIFIVAMVILLGCRTVKPKFTTTTNNNINCLQDLPFTFGQSMDSLKESLGENIFETSGEGKKIGDFGQFAPVEQFTRVFGAFFGVLSDDLNKVDALTICYFTRAVARLEDYNAQIEIVTPTLLQCFSGLKDWLENESLLGYIEEFNGYKIIGERFDDKDVFLKIVRVEK